MQLLIRHLPQRCHCDWIVLRVKRPQSTYSSLQRSKPAEDTSHRARHAAPPTRTNTFRRLTPALPAAPSKSSRSEWLPLGPPPALRCPPFPSRVPHELKPSRQHAGDTRAECLDPASSSTRPTRLRSRPAADALRL